MARKDMARKDVTRTDTASKNVSRKQASTSSCPVTRGEVDLDWYAERDGVWRELGLAAPARRALVNAGILKTSDLKRFTAEEILALHGIGKTVLPKLQPFLKR